MNKKISLFIVYIIVSLCNIKAMNDINNWRSPSPIEIVPIETPVPVYPKSIETEFSVDGKETLWKIKTNTKKCIQWNFDAEFYIPKQYYKQQYDYQIIHQYIAIHLTLGEIESNNITITCVDANELVLTASSIHDMINYFNSIRHYNYTIENIIFMTLNHLRQISTKRLNRYVDRVEFMFTFFEELRYWRMSIFVVNRH